MIASRLAAALAVLLTVPSAAAAREHDDCPRGMKRLAGGEIQLADGRIALVASFCMDVTEVTVGAYARCVDVGACSAEKLECGPAATWGKKGFSSHPVNCVDWNESDAYCRVHGKRLPSEEEWEWAARGGNRARTYPWGEAPPAALACWDGNGNEKGKDQRKETCPVASHPKARSADGLEDLAGNVREWTSTENERFRILRGGSWGDSLPEFLSTSFRAWNAPDERMELIGFRCVAAPGTKVVVPTRAAPKAVMQDDGVLVMPFEIRPSRRN